MTTKTGFIFPQIIEKVFDFLNFGSGGILKWIVFERNFAVRDLRFWLHVKDFVLLEKKLENRLELTRKIR